MGERGGDPITLGKHRGQFCVVIGKGRARRRRSLGTADPAAARARFADFERSYEINQRPERVTVGHIMDGYAADRQAEVVAPKRIGYAIAKLRPVFGDLYPTHITKALCKRYAAGRAASGIADGTIHTELGVLRVALRWAVKQQPPLIAEAPTVWRPTKPAPKDRSLTRAEAERLREASVLPHVKLFVALALGTAARAAAILDLTWDRVDFDRRLIALYAPQKGATKKGRATVPINDTLLGELLAANRGRISNYVVELAGRQVGSVKKGVAQAAKRAGLAGVSPHVLRHTAAVWMAEAGVPMPQIAAFMGHSDSRTTERVYAKLSPTFLMEAARALERRR